MLGGGGGKTATSTASTGFGGDTYGAPDQSNVALWVLGGLAVVMAGLAVFLALRK
jgi:hypothetical protein